MGGRRRRRGRASLVTLNREDCARMRKLRSQKKERLQEMDLLVLDPTVLTMVGRYRADVFGVPARGDNDAMRHYAYHQFVLWRHGKLGIVSLVLPISLYPTPFSSLSSRNATAGARTTRLSLSAMLPECQQTLSKSPVRARRSRDLINVRQSKLRLARPLWFPAINTIRNFS
ncbi:hypothetical protein LSAT2_001310 [Lamellibrachia satsuma]|nr:hypothetical protein LSAT2_001310 [Lamellibrachia satsuma]